MSAVLKFPEKISLNELASTCVERADGDWTVAAQMMEEHVRSNDPLFRELMDPLVSGAVWNLVRQSARQTRRQYHVQAKVPDVDGIKAVAKSWYNYPIYGGVRLGDATKDNLLEAIEGYRMQEESNRQRREFMERILKKVPKGKTVRESLSEDQIGKLA